MKSFWIVALLVVCGLALAQDKALPPAGTPPALTETQRLQIQLAAKEVELWQIKAQQAAQEYERAGAALRALVAKLTPSGYTLNDRLELVPLPKAPDK